MVSGYFYRDDRLIQETLRSGLIYAFVTKPFRHDEMLNAIHAVLPTG
jgi:DNA-binding response OmpR family regulator